MNSMLWGLGRSLSSLAGGDPASPSAAFEDQENMFITQEGDAQAYMPQTGGQTSSNASASCQDSVTALVILDSALDSLDPLPLDKVHTAKRARPDDSDEQNGSRHPKVRVVIPSDHSELQNQMKNICAERDSLLAQLRDISILGGTLDEQESLEEPSRDLQAVRRAVITRSFIHRQIESSTEEIRRLLETSVQSHIATQEIQRVTREQFQAAYQSLIDEHATELLSVREEQEMERNLLGVSASPLLDNLRGLNQQLAEALNYIKVLEEERASITNQHNFSQQLHNFGSRDGTINIPPTNQVDVQIVHTSTCDKPNSGKRMRSMEDDNDMANFSRPPKVRVVVPSEYVELREKEYSMAVEAVVTLKEALNHLQKEKYELEQALERFKHVWVAHRSLFDALLDL